MKLEVFADVYRLLEAAHSWKKVSDESVSLFYTNCSKGLTNDELDDLCGQLLDDESLVRPSRFLRAISNVVADKARYANESGCLNKTTANTQCEEFARFSRAMRELKSSLATGRSYPGRQRKDEHCQEWLDEWNRPLTGDDEVYAENRRVSRIVEIAGISIPVGGVK